MVEIQSAPKIWTIKEVLTWSTDFLRKKDFPTARLDVEILLSRCLKLTRIQLYTFFDRPLDNKERQKFKGFLQRRVKNEPVAYITENREFYGRDFFVDKRVLIPRPDTETLVERFLECKPTTAHNVLDIGTGSGCLAITIAKEVEGITVEAWDISDSALEIAKVNNQNHDAGVNFLNRDCLDEESWDPSTTQFDYIVSNPPYISDNELPELPLSVSEYEPHNALLAGAEGTEFYQALARYAKLRLKSSGMILVEVGNTQSAAVIKIFTEAGWRHVQSHRDLAGVDRVVEARL